MSASRIKELETLITRYQKSYYDGEGEISDAEFDKLWDELKELDPANAILHRVGVLFKEKWVCLLRVALV